jgi:predicted NBD/HSP70 family sugar kinase
MHPSDLRHIHASHIFHAIRLRPNMSQREIAEVAGADKSTVSAVIRGFEAEGLIERMPSRGGARPGRPGERIVLSSRGGLLVGVHLRPEGLRFVVSGLDGGPLHSIGHPLSEPAGLGAAIKAGIAAITAAIGRNAREVRAVGVSVQGLLNRDGVLTQSPNLGWTEVALARILRAAIRLPIFIENNANAAAVAESFFGGGADGGDFAYVESGSGVGAGLFLNGSLYRGVHGFAGEFGHTKVVPHGRPCRCGALGCLSAYASDYSILQRLRQKGVDAGSRADILAGAQAGDRATLAVLLEASRQLGVAIANLINLLNIRRIILGGGLGVLAPYLLPGIEENVMELALPSAAAGCRIEVSRIDAWDVPLGGIALALEGCTSLIETEATPW